MNDCLYDFDSLGLEENKPARGLATPLVNYL